MTDTLTIVGHTLQQGNMELYSSSSNCFVLLQAVAPSLCAHLLLCGWCTRTPEHTLNLGYGIVQARDPTPHSWSISFRFFRHGACKDATVCRARGCWRGISRVFLRPRLKGQRKALPDKTVIVRRRETPHPRGRPLIMLVDHTLSGVQTVFYYNISSSSRTYHSCTSYTARC